MKYHITREGKKIKLADLELSHLENIIRWIERKAKEGLTVITGGSGSYAEDMWVDVDTYYGKKAKAKLNFSDYQVELERRKVANKISSNAEYMLAFPLPTDMEMDEQILKIMDENLVAGTVAENTEGIICNRFDTSLKIVHYIKRLVGNER